MPGLNRTGPQGQGSMTGGARGNCNSAGIPIRSSITRTMGFGRGMAYGRGHSRGSFGNGMGIKRGYSRNTGINVEEIDMLKVEVELLNKRIAELEETL